MSHRPPEKSLVLFSGAMPRLMDDPGDLLVLGSGPGRLLSEQLGVAVAQEVLELMLVIERRHHDVPPLSARWVVPVVQCDEAPDGVVLRINSRHAVQDKAECAASGESLVQTDRDPLTRRRIRMVAGDCDP